MRGVRCERHFDLPAESLPRQLTPRLLLALLSGLERPSQGPDPVKALSAGAAQQLGIRAVPHGFRSSFRDWAAERTDHPREVVEVALEYVVRNQTETAYARSDLFERRRRLMDDWMGYLARQPRTGSRASGTDSVGRSVST